MIWFLGNFPSHLIEKLRNIIIEFLIWRSIHFLESRLHKWEKNKSRCTYLTEIAKQIPNRTILSERASLINRKPSNQGIYCTRVTWVSVQDKNKIYELFNFSWVSAFNILLKTLCHWKKQSIHVYRLQFIFNVGWPLDAVDGVEDYHYREGSGSPGPLRSDLSSHS